MDRTAEALLLSEEILEDIELSRLSPMQIVMKASRLVRLVPNEDFANFLRYEREGYPLDGTDGAWLRRAGRESGKSEGKYFFVPLSKIVANAESSKARLDSDKGGRSFSGDYGSIASTNHDNHLSKHAEVLGMMQSVATQVVTTVYDQVSAMNHELKFSAIQESLFQQAQTEVDGTLGSLDRTLLSKIESVTARLRGGDGEAVSQAMSTCRRLIDAVADALVPARDEPVVVDGQPLKAGRSNVLNRLQIWAYESGAPKGRRDRLRRTVSDLYDRTSTGLHAEVSSGEARFVFLQTYVALGELIRLAPAGAAHSD
ncbi:hypothetical protein JNB_04710 [Janibacter sp. HTCC2649]|uniref:AbiTii domain-containing protein n=1 Tax=Janibacter sp. HTCC2649 TaxID=313589 RepID=UPI000066EC4A|nr:hypothetical protein [Janibacter sp. HTCC2649]EAP99444.1 hypothetical protein JNB_04710 [Janibacter sp. HTCC2649]